MWTAIPQPSTLLYVGLVNSKLNGSIARSRPMSSEVVSTVCASPLAIRISKTGEFGPQSITSTRNFEPCIQHCRALLKCSIQMIFRSSARRSDSLLHEKSGICSHVKNNGEVSQEDNNGEAWLVDEVITPFNHISVIEVGSKVDHELAGAYILKLDDRDLVHSVYWHDQRVWTDAYYDEFTILPALIPPGPIAILGLGAGTVARLLLHVWPSRQLEGWEIDPEVVRVGRAYFGLADLEVARQKDSRRQGRGQHVQKNMTSRSALVVHVADALGQNATAEGRFAGLIVDMYSHGRICEALKDRSVWAMLRRRLLPGGRVMVNCGGPPVANRQDEADQEAVWETNEWEKEVDAIIIALSAAFNGEINIKHLQDEGRNVLLLSGQLASIADLSKQPSSQMVNRILGWQQQTGELHLQ